MAPLTALIPTLVGVAALCAVSLGVLRGAGIAQPASPSIAVLRAALQLAVIGLILGVVITSTVWVSVAVAVMFAVAVATSTSRLGWSGRHLRIVATGMASGSLTALAIVFGTGALAFTPRYVLAIGGIVVGNSMAITTLAARRFIEAADEHWEEVEGWLALGAPPVASTARIAKRAVHTALVPSVDQTKTTGLVTLPGAFVGAIFGGLSPLEAGRFQIVVLAAIVTAGSLTTVITVRLLADIRQRPIAAAR